MFRKQRLRFPRLGGLTVGDMVLADARDLSDQAHSEAALEPIRQAWAKLQEWSTAQREEVLICANDRSVEGRYNAAFDIYRRGRPDRTTDDFDLVYKPTYDDTDVDPRLGAISFTVSIGGTFIGLFHLYNVRLEGEMDELGVQKITAAISPSITTPRGYLDPDDVGEIMDALLLEDIPVAEAQRVIDLVQWDFPTREDRKWTTSFAASVFTHLGEHERTDKDEAPSKVRRRNVSP